MGSSFNILCIDGGGIRGIIPARMLVMLETMLKAKYRQSLSDYFDMVAGTSTGAIISAGLAQGQKPAELQRVYYERGDDIFPYRSRWSLERLGVILENGLSAPKYDSGPLSSLLREKLGHTAVAELPADFHVLIPFYDTLERKTRFIKSYSTTDAEPAFGNMPVWEAVLCSSSAPTYFPAHPMMYKGKRYSAIDGGVAANNPIACAVADAIHLAKGKPIRVITLGTGAHVREIPTSDALEWGALEWSVPIVDVLMDASLDVHNYIVEKLIGESQVLRLQFRLDTEQWQTEPLNDDMDDASQDNLDSLLFATEAYLDTVKARVFDFL